MSSSDAGKIHDNPYLYAVGMIALTWALWEGSSKVQKFFGLDTGLKQGWSKVAGGIAATEYIAGKGKNLAEGAVGVARGSGKLAGAAIGEAQAWQAGSSTKAIAKENGASNSEAKQAGSYARRAFRSAHNDFKQNGGSAVDWNRAVNSGAVSETVQDEAARMMRNGGLTDNQYNTLHHNPYMQNRAEKNGGSAEPTGIGRDTSFVGNPNYDGKKETVATSNVDSAKNVNDQGKNTSVKPDNIQNQGIKTDDSKPKSNAAKESSTDGSIKSTGGAKTIGNDAKIPNTTVSEATNGSKTGKKETANDPRTNSASVTGSGSKRGEANSSSSSPTSSNAVDELPSLRDTQKSTSELASQQRSNQQTTPPKPVGEGGRHLSNVSDFKGQDSHSKVTETAGTNHVDIERKAGRTEVSTHDVGNQGMSSVKDAMKSSVPSNTNRTVETQGNTNTVTEIKHDKTTINQQVENSTETKSPSSTNIGKLGHGDSRRKD